MKAYDIMKCRHTRHYRLHLTSQKLYPMRDMEPFCYSQSESQVDSDRSRVYQRSVYADWKLSQILV